MSLDLNGFTGTENYYRHGLVRDLYFTDGVKYVADAAGAYWLLDAIASHQPTVRKNKMCREIQFWKLRALGHGAVLECYEDTGREPIVRQEIPYTDFPEKEIDLWVEYGSIDGENPAYIMLLPSEH